MRARLAGGAGSAAAHAPFFAGADPTLMGMDSWTELSNPRDLGKGNSDEWLAATPEGPRAIDDHELARRAHAAGVTMTPAGSVTAAMQAAASKAQPGDRVVVFGSFHTVGPALASLGVPL